MAFPALASIVAVRGFGYHRQQLFLGGGDSYIKIALSWWELNDRRAEELCPFLGAL